MKDWFLNLWQDIKEDPFGFIFELIFVLVFSSVLFALIVLFYGTCTGQITKRSYKSFHGLMPVYTGKYVILIPY